MATENYNLPTITGNMTADVVRDVNALAEATDTAIKVAVDGIDLTNIEQEISDVDSRVTAHLADDAIHLTAEKVNKQIEQTDFKIYKSGKDANGVFTTVEYKRNDGTLAVKSVLNGGTSPKYTTRTITYYGLDGTTVEKTTTRTMSYDSDGVLVSEV